MALKDFQSGKKTYAIVAVGIALGVVQGLNYMHVTNIQIPGFADWLLTFMGLGAARMGIQTQAANTTENVVALVQAVMTQIEAPEQPVTVNGKTIIVGKPTPPTSPESSVTAALNKAQAGKL